MNEHNPDHEDLPLTFLEKFIIWTLLIVIFISLAILLAITIIYIGINGKIILQNNPLIIHIILPIIVIIKSFSICIAITNKLQNYLFVDWYFLKGITLFAISLATLVVAAV